MEMYVYQKVKNKVCSYTFRLVESDGTIYKEKRGSFEADNNFRAQIKVLIKALDYGNYLNVSNIFINSGYVVEGYNNWIESWNASNWEKEKGSIKNVDLWKKVYTVKSKQITCYELNDSNYYYEEIKKTVI